MRKIAVTGGPATGKSSVCQLLQEFGAFVISADAIAHELLCPSTEIGKKIIEIFGNEVVENGVFDRKKIADLAFTDQAKLRKLEKILHPVILSEIQKKYQELLTHNPPPLFVVEIPLLFEISAETLFDDVVVVVAPETLCRKRFVAAFNQGEEQYLLRTARLLPETEKIEKANFVIYNDGSKERLRKQVKTLFDLLYR